jgi:uncharacterized protein GlcG (DUF336 family)
MNRISLVQANRIIEGAFAKGASLKLKPLSATVLDPGGHVIAFQRQDNASNLRFGIALGKAAGALSMGVSSRKIGEMAAERPSFVASLAAIAPNGMIPAAGGVIVVDGSGQILGAAGVTGDTSDNDEVCVLAGIEAAGLKAQG